MSVPCNISTFLNISPYRLYDCLYSKKPLKIFQGTCLLFVTFYLTSVRGTKRTVGFRFYVLADIFIMQVCFEILAFPLVWLGTKTLKTTSVFVRISSQITTLY